MTKTEIMQNRILSKEAVEEVTEIYHDWHRPDFHENLTEEECEERMYISPERVQRMSPEDVFEHLCEYYGYNADTVHGMIPLLAIATGRTEEDVRTAIFGSGEFDPMKFYQPTAKQKVIIKFFLKVAPELLKQGVHFGDYSKWPQATKDEWEQITKDVPSEASTEFYGEVNQYIQYYTTNGIPNWCY